MKYRLSLHYLFVFLFVFAAIPCTTNGQDRDSAGNTSSPAGGENLPEVGEERSSREDEESNPLENIRLSGYVQALFQKASAPGIKSFSGGDFEENVDQRFTVRRGRMKLTYDAGLSSAVVQIDATEEGVIIRDAYILFTEPKWQTFGLQAGVQNRAFGYAVVYSSSRRETPERSRLFQTLFAGERDAGVKLIIAPPEESMLGFLEMEAGFYNGSGTVSDYDSNKDFIGRLHTAFEGEAAPWQLGLGVSWYSGGQRQNTRYSYKMTGDNDFYTLDSAESNIGKTAERRYYGVDLQAAYDFSFGNSEIRAEYIAGKQPGSSTSSRTPRSRPDEATWHREFEGAYAIFVQELGNSPLEAFVKYDFYDPNREISAEAIDEGFTEGDIRFWTWGYGLAWKYDEHITFTAYYEDVNNEETQLSGFTEDVSDNVLSLRIQYRF